LQQTRKYIINARHVAITRNNDLCVGLNVWN